MIKIETTGSMASVEVRGTGEELANETIALLLGLYDKSPELVRDIITTVTVAIMTGNTDISSDSVEFDHDIGLTGLKKQKS